MLDTLEAFYEVKRRLTESGLVSGDLICKVGGPGTFKLMKRGWSNDSPDILRNFSGIFFSIWEDERERGPERLLYNIHALKLRELNGYELTSRKFAEDFRAEFAQVSDQWPNVSTEHGPLTLMQGWIEKRPTELVSDACVLANRFSDLIPLIDRLLAAKRRR